MSLSKNPAFNLKAVLQETNIAADTLRAWERRYGLPMPQRTAGGHRHYSQYDIETIKWLLARQSEGLSISHAVDSWNEKIASGTDPLAVATSQSLSTPTTLKLPSETNMDTLRALWLSACLEFNEAKAEEVLNQAFALHSIESVCIELLQRGLSEIGDQWLENQASVQQEHFTSALAIRRMNTLISASPAPTRKQTILVGCPAEEAHTFTPLLISFFLRRRGFNVIYLGANVPDERFEETVNFVRADLVVLVAQQLITAASLQKTAHMLAQHNIPVAFGGRIFALQPQIFRNITGFYLGSKIKDSFEQIEDLASTKVKSPQAIPVAQKYETAATEFQLHRSNIEATLNQFIDSLGNSEEAMKTATKFLGDNIIAALHLGDISLVEGELDWVKTLIKANHIPEIALTEYIKMYAKAVDSNINDSGRLISEWLNKLAHSD